MATCPTCRVLYPDDQTSCPTDGDALLPDQAFTAADHDLKQGEKVGEYRVEGKIGEGGFGAVFKAVHPVIGKQVAIKVLHRQFSSNPEMVSRFIAEARAVNQIGHRHIIDIFAFGQLADGRHYYVMELLGGLSLDQLVQQQGRLGLDQAVVIMRALARALDAAHAKGIAHRDLKPENVFISQDDDGALFPKLLDFGIAKLLNTTGGSTMHKTRTGVPIGTPFYMSPEQCRGRQVDHRTDYYSFGIMAYQMLTGYLPFTGQDFMDVIVKQTSDTETPPSKLCPDLPPAVDRIVHWLLEKDAANRPPNLTAAVRELEESILAAGVPLPSVPQPGSFGRVPTPSDLSRSPTPALLPRLTPADVAELGAANTMQVSSSSLPLGISAAPALSTSTVPSASPARRSRVWIAVGLAAVAVVGVVAFGRGKPSRGVVPAVAVPPDALSVALVQAVSPPPAVPAPSATVKLQIEGAPAGAEVVGVDGRVLGHTPDVIELPRASSSVTLELRAAGYQPYPATLVPVRDIKLTVKLKKSPARPAAGVARPKRPDLNSIENAF